MRASSSRTPSRKEESERYTATLRRRCIARAQEARQAVLSRQRGISDGLDASAVARDIISAELREASCAGWARRGPSQDGEPDPHADLDFEAYAELLAATEQSLLAELREDVASLDGPGGEEYEAFLDWAAQGDEARLREAADGVHALAFIIKRVPDEYAAVRVKMMEELMVAQSPRSSKSRLFEIRIQI